MTFHYQSAEEIGKSYRSSDISPTEVTESFLARIEQLDGELLSYATVMRDQALEDAEAATRMFKNGEDLGPLHGIPIAVKDLCFTKGTKTMGGTAVLEDFVPDFDSTVVSKLKAAGAILLGKLNLTEGAMGGYNPKRQAPKNPWDFSKWPGGSSSGSGSATAAGLCTGSLGSDTGGSIRFPSAACGIVGIKPSYGKVSRYGVLDLGQSLDHVGPMTRNVVDAAMILNAISGLDENDSTTRTSLPISVDELKKMDLNGVRIGYDHDYSYEGVDSEIADLVLGTLDVLKDSGAVIVDMTMPSVDDYLGAWKTLCSAEALDAHSEHYPSRSNDYGLWFRGWLENGASVTALDYVRANNDRIKCNALIAEAFSEVDAMICPTIIRFPHDVDDSVHYGPMDSLRGTSFQRFTVPFDYNGYPTVSVPCGFGSQGMPASLQIVGKLFSEELICKIAYSYEISTEWHKRHPIP